MRLYDCTTAPSPRRVRIFLAEKGLEIPIVQVDLRNGEHLEPAFRAINPRCTVPVLELENGTFLWETLAICSYLEDRHPEPALMGRDPQERAEVLQWTCRGSDDGFQGVAEALRNGAKGFQNRALTGPDDFAQIPDLVERGRRRTEIFFRELDAHLKDRPFLVGDSLTLADITAWVVVDFASWIKISIPGSRPELRRWYDQLAARPSMA